MITLAFHKVHEIDVTEICMGELGGEIDREFYRLNRERADQELPLFDDYELIGYRLIHDSSANNEGKVLFADIGLRFETDGGW